MEKKAIRCCPICSEEFVNILHRQKFILPEGHPLAKGYDVVSCKKCGFVYADVQVTQEAYDVFYAKFSKYGDTKTSTGGGQNPFDTARLKETARIIASILPDKDARIIDVGCANGGLLKEVYSLGYPHLLGVDPAEICIEQTCSLYGIDARIGTLSNLPVDIGHFDLVILSHVLEHIQDLHQAILQVSNLVSEGGKVYVEVPDATRYADHISAPYQDFNTEHINHFSIKAIHNLFGKINFAPVQDAKRIIAINDNIDYPVIHTVLKRGSVEKSILYDKELNENISRYISLSQDILNTLDKRLQEILICHPNVIVWGTGQLAMKLLAETCLGTANIIVFVDGNPVNHGNIILGKPVISPLALKVMDPYPIIITTLLHYRSIQEDIQQLGLCNPVYILE